MNRQTTTIAIYSLLIVSLIGCSASEPPTRSWEIAAQGAFSGSLSSQADMVIVGSLNHGASLWKTPEHERLYNWRHKAGDFVELVSSSFFPDGTRAVTTDPSTLVLWNTATGEAINYWGTPGAVLDVAMFADNRQALLGLDNHTALVFDAETGAYQQTLIHEGDVGSVAISKDGNTAITGSDDFTAVYWDLNTAAPLQTYKHDNPVRAVALSATGRFAFTAAQNDLVALWDNQYGTKLHELHNGDYHGVVTAEFSEDERFLAVGYTNRKVSLFDVATGQLLRTWDPGVKHQLRATGATILAVGFRANANAILALTGDGRLLEFRTS
ncbi:MAG: hypothetical protein GKR90_19060 [Pseudomonadales bacterium]|nr:hypothetical protein [Pseudomonadales bacterium]